MVEQSLFSPIQKEMVYEKKMLLHLEEKKKIAKRAAELIQHGDTIAVDVGSTTVHIADMIENVQGLTVLTNSLSAAYRFNLAIEEHRMTGTGDYVARDYQSLSIIRQGNIHR